jgi:hypothetical protein
LGALLEQRVHRLRVGTHNFGVGIELRLLRRCYLQLFFEGGNLSFHTCDKSGVPARSLRRYRIGTARLCDLVCSMG